MYIRSNEVMTSFMVEYCHLSIVSFTQPFQQMDTILKHILEPYCFSMLRSVGTWDMDFS